MLRNNWQAEKKIIKPKKNVLKCLKTAAIDPELLLFKCFNQELGLHIEFIPPDSQGKGEKIPQQKQVS